VSRLKVLSVARKSEIIPQRERGTDDAMEGKEWTSECSIRFADWQFQQHHSKAGKEGHGYLKRTVSLTGSKAIEYKTSK
jgi:hypothetical protein